MNGHIIAQKKKNYLTRFLQKKITLLRLSTNMDVATSTENQQSRHLVIVTCMFSLSLFIYFLTQTATVSQQYAKKTFFDSFSFVL